VQVSGDGGPANQNFRLLATTNLALPVASWLPVQTGAFDSTGAFTVSDPGPAVLDKQFYIIAVP
jgi:hypothetical protein